MTKLFITICFSLMVSSINAQKIKLNYEPQKPIIVFQNFSDLNKDIKIYTDTVSLFFNMQQSFKPNYKNSCLINDTLYSKRIKKLVLSELMKSNNDTIYFQGGYIPFNDGLDINQLMGYRGLKDNSWNIYDVIFLLMNRNNLKIIDSLGNQVKTIKINKRKVRTHPKYISTVYLDKDTKEELFIKIFYLETPIW